MSELTASTLPKTRGAGFVARSSDVDCIEELEQQGYTLSGTPEDGFSIFVFKDDALGSNDCATSNMVMEAEDEEEDEDAGTEGAPVFKGHGDGIPLVWRPTTVGTRDSWQYDIHGTDGPQRVIAEVVFEHAVDRSHPDRLGLCLRVKQAQFGVNGCVNNKTRRGHFVHKLVITAEPRETWRYKVAYVIPEPSDDTKVPSSTKQESVTMNGQANLSKTPAVTAGISITTGTTFDGKPAHGWPPAVLDICTRSVTWTWGIKQWKDGSEYRSRNPGLVKSRFKNLPELPFESPRLFVLLNKCGIEAEWMVPRDELVGMNEVQWDVSVKLHTAIVQKVNIFKGNSFQCYDDIPIIHKVIEEKLAAEL